MKTKSVSKDKLDGMLKKAIKQVEDVGIESSLSILPKVRTYKATSYFGQVVYKREFGMCEITISEYHLNNGYDAVMQTLVHEVLHTCEDGRGHTGRWKEYASIVNEAYGYNVSRTGSQDAGHTLPEREHKVKYLIGCLGCDNTWERVRKSKLVTNTNNYSCGACKSELVRLK